MKYIKIDDFEDLKTQIHIKITIKKNNSIFKNDFQYLNKYISENKL